MCAELLRLLMSDSNLSVFIFVESRDDMMSYTQADYFLKVVIPLESGFGCSRPEISCVQQVELIMIDCGVKGGHPVSAVLRTVVV